MRLKGKVPIITGGAQGIGLATARMFAAEGAIVAIAGLKREPVDEALRELRGSGTTAEDFTVDVTRREQIDAMVPRLKVSFGRIDVLVNNAGITLDARLQKMTEVRFDTVIAVNLKGARNCAQAVIETMIEERSGVILNASSVVGIYGHCGQSSDAASGFGVIGFAKTRARELGPKGIRCHAVCPGFIATPILKTIPDKVTAQMTERVPMKRLGRPEKVADVYAYPASDEASYINGAVTEVAGGLTV